MNWFLTLMVALLAAMFAGPANAAELAFYNNTVYVQESTGGRLYAAPLMPGVYNINSNPTGWFPKDISGSGDDGNACMLWAGNLQCASGGTSLSQPWDWVDSGAGFTAVRNGNETLVRLPAGGRMSMSVMSQIDFTSELMCGTLYNNEVMCRDNQGVGIVFPFLPAPARKVEVGRATSDDHHAFVVMDDGRLWHYNFPADQLEDVTRVDYTSDVAVFRDTVCQMSEDVWGVSAIYCANLSAAPLTWVEVFRPWAGASPAMWLTDDGMGITYLLLKEMAALEVIALPPL